MASITDRYSDPGEFDLLLDRIGLSAAQRRRFTNDGFTTMKTLVDHYQVLGPADFEKYLNHLNKTFSSAAPAQRVYYNPVIMSRLVGSLNYFLISVYSLHIVPDIQLVTAEEASDYGRIWMKVQGELNDDKRTNDVDF